MTVKEQRVINVPGMNGGREYQYRVRVLEDGEQVPVGAIRVDDSTPATDWIKEIATKRPFGD